jgi:hypothetical protein
MAERSEEDLAAIDDCHRARVERGAGMTLGNGPTPMVAHVLAVCEGNRVNYICTCTFRYPIHQLSKCKDYMYTSF